MMKFLLKKITLAAVFISQPGMSQIVINEVMVKPSGSQGMISGGKEYVEIYNNSCQQVDIGCFIIANRTAGGIYDNNGGFKFPPGTVINPYQHLVVGTQYSSTDSNNIDFNTNNYPLFVCNTGNWLLGNYDAWIALYDDNGIPLDAIYWSMNANQAGNISTGTDYDDNPCLPPGCSGTFTLSSAKQIFNNYSSAISYVGQAPSTNLTYSRIPDGGTWQREISPSISNSSSTGNCNGGTCNQGLVFTVNTSYTDAVCGTNNGSAAATVSPAGTYTYLWSANAGSQATATASGLNAGTYYITVTNTSGCSAVDTVIIANSGGPQITLSSTAATCGNNNGTVTATVSGGNSPYSFSWNTMPAQTDPVATGLAAGTYSVTVTDNNSCTVAQSATVPGSPAVSVMVSPATCSDSNGTAAANVSGGTTPFSYLWSTNPPQNNQTATGLPAGSYSVTVTDGLGCSATGDAVITGGPIVVLTANPSTCGNSDGNITAIPNGGSSPYSYLWNNSQTTQTITGLIAGVYFVTVTDNNNCTVAASEIVSNLGGPTLTTYISPEYCSSANGSVAVSPTGGNPPFSYLWNTIPVQNDSIAAGLVAGTYSVTVTDDYNCKAISTVTVTSISGPTITTTLTNASCGQSDGKITVNLTGGSPPFQFSSDGGINFQANNEFNNLSEGSYIIVAKDSLNCSDSNAVTIVSSGGISVSGSVLDANCEEASNGSASASPTGGTSPYSYQWSNNQVAQTATGLSTGNYSVTVTDSSGCSGSYQFTVSSAGVGPVADILENDTMTDYGTNLQLHAVGGATYSWNTGETTAEITVNLLSATTISVTVTDAAGCTDADSIHIIMDESKHEIAVSTVFSPNNDGINDIIKIHGFGIREVKMVIYDRWGEKIKEIKDMDDSWDGTFKGKPLNSAVFVYTLDAIFLNGENFRKKGNITLLK